MNDLHVDRKFAATIVDDQHAHAAAAVGEGIAETPPQVLVIDDGQALADLAALGHGDHGAVLAHVEHAVLLEDGAEHALHHDRRGRVADEARLLVQLLGEEVDAEVAVLAGVRGRGDADHLAGAALQHEQVADADVVARDGDRVRRAVALDVAHIVAARPGVVAHDAVSLDHDVLVIIVVVVVMVRAVEGVPDALGGTLEATAEGVVVAFVVVVTHAAVRGVDGLLGFDVHVLPLGIAAFVLKIVGGAAAFDVDRGSGGVALVLDVVRGAGSAALEVDIDGPAALAIDFDVVGRIQATAVLALGNVDLGFFARTFTLDVDVNFGAADGLLLTAAPQDWN